MRLEGKRTVGAPRERVWELLIDPRQAGACVPGIGAIEVVDATHFAVTKVGVGAVSANVTVNVEQVDLQAPEHIAYLAKGRARGISVEARAGIDLRDGRQAGTTELAWSVDAEVGGPLASVGVRMIDRSARSLIAQTLRCVDLRLSGASSEIAAALSSPAAEVKRLDPDWCLFWGGRVSSGQLDGWIPYIRRSRHRFAIMTPDDIAPEDRERIAALPNAIVVEPYVQGIEWLRAGRSFRGYLYVEQRPENFTTVNRHPRHAHVYVGHGQGGTGASGFRAGSLYDSIFVAEYADVDRFPRAIRRRVRRGAIAVGPQVVDGASPDPPSIEDAVRTFDVALDTLRWRNLPVPLRIPFAVKLLTSRFRGRP